MDEENSKRFVTCLIGLYNVVCKDENRELPVYYNLPTPIWKDYAPNYFAKHQTKASAWNYVNDLSLLYDANNQLDWNSIETKIDLRTPPPRYIDIVKDENNTNTRFYFDSNGKSIEFLNDWKSFKLNGNLIKRFKNFISNTCRLLFEQKQNLGHKYAKMKTKIM